MEEAIKKLKEHFSDMVVYKDLQKNNFFSQLSMPSFMRDWIIKRFQNSEGLVGDIELTRIREFIATHLPHKRDFKKIVNRIINENERVKILTRVTAHISVDTGEFSFSLPDYSVLHKDTKVPQKVWDEYHEDLLGSEDIWGVVELGYVSGDSSSKNAKDKKGKITLTDFKKFKPYSVNLEAYKDARTHFTTDEWIDVLLGAIDYNPEGYQEKKQKMTMLSRLLPFVERRLNLLELAPKGTGKSYIFGGLSRYGYLIGGGTISRARIFYNKSTSERGLIFKNDYLALDEIQTLDYADPNDLASAFKTYMESGEYKGDAYQGTADCGIVFLGNIKEDNMNEFRYMLDELPTLFKESAFLDRLHGFIKGWDIPRVNDGIIMNNFALNSEYFTSIMNLLREDSSYRQIVENCITRPQKADTRDREAIIRIATGFTKLLFPHVRKAEDMDLDEFNEYCLRPAKSMRDIIKFQMGLIDPEFKGKNVPDIRAKESHSGSTLATIEDF